MRKLTAVGLAALAVLSLAAIAPAKTTTLTYMYWWTGQQDRDFTTRSIDAFEKANPGIKVKIIHQTWGMEADYTARILTMTAGNASPDVIALPFHIFPRFVEKGLLEPVNAYLAKDSVKMDDWMAVGQSAVKWGKKTWGLPFHGSSWWVTYNKRLLSEAGLPDLEALYADGNWNWEVLSEIATKSTKFSNTGKAEKTGVGTYASYQSVLPFVRGLGGEMFGGGDSVKPTLTRPEVIKGVDYMTDLINVKKCLNMFNDPVGNFVQGKGAMLFWWDSIPASLQILAKGKLQMNQVPFPKGPVNAKDIHAEYHAMTMASQGKHKQEAWKLVKWMTNKETTARLAATCGYFLPRYDSLPTYKAAWARDGLTGTGRFLEEAMSRTEVESRFPTFSLVYGKVDEMIVKAYQKKISASAAMTEAQRYAQVMMKTK